MVDFKTAAKRPARISEPEPAFEPTAEQQAAVIAARDTGDNLLITALAGAAKTTTLVLIAEALPEQEILCLAFNKKIATEMQARLPSNCVAKTLNSLGHTIWGQAIGKRLVVNTDKNYNLLSAAIEGLSSDMKNEVFERFSEILQAVRFGKSCGYVPDNKEGTGPGKLRGLMGTDEYFAHIEEIFPEWIIELIETVSARSIEMAWRGEIDFDDQILMPTCGIGAFPRYPVTLVDEAQDLSALNHRMLEKLVGKRRLIAVGDKHQAIYGFRGAHEDSMELLREKFSMTELTLNTSFRCPISVVQEARSRAPHMHWPDWAKEGQVTHLHEWDHSAIPDNAAILCRNNAPLFGMALKLLKAGRYPELIGNDIGKALVKIMKKFGKSQMPRADVETAILAWKEAQSVKSRNKANVADRAECMLIFASAGDTLGDAIAFAEHIFASSGPIKLMTGHKSKGLEFDHVFLLDPQLIGKERQEPNIRYVMQTRAKFSLTYLRSENYVG